jgi:DNA polymerase-3 subunit alpha
MQKLLKDSECDDFNCLAAITALGRPGPLQSKMTEAYCLRKRGEEKYKIHPVLKEVLDYTYGIVVYQEQIMQIVNKLAGFSLAETDLFRKVLIKVKKDTKDGMWDKLQEYKKKFLEGGKKHMSESELLELFDGFLKWAGYGFNKSHAVAYTVISYRCAWLKTYFPLEYICTVLGNVSKGEIKIKGKTTNKYGDYTAEAASLNILFMPIDINKSKVNFATENEKIRQGFTNIKNVGIAPATQIVENQPYTSFTDFVNKNQNISKRVIEPLIKIGAFDELHSNRKKLLIDYYKSKKMKFPKEIERLNKYSDFFSILIKKDLTKLVEDPEHDLKDFTEKEKGLIFREMAGFWIEHPMEKMREKIDENKIEIGRVSEMYQNLYTAAIVYIDEIEEDTPKSKSFKLKISDGNKKLDGTSITINKEYLKSDEKLIVGKKIFLGLMHNVDWGKAEYFRFCKLQFIDDDLKDFEQLSNAYKSMNVLLTKFKKFKEKHKDKVRHESLKDATKYAQIELASLTVEERATGKVDTKVLVYFLGKVKDTAKQTVLEFGDETSTTLVYAWQNVAETFMQTYKPGAFLQITIESKYLGASNYLFKMLKNDKSLEN